MPGIASVFFGNGILIFLWGPLVLYLQSRRCKWKWAQELGLSVILFHSWQQELIQTWGKSQDSPCQQFLGFCWNFQEKDSHFYRALSPTVRAVNTWAAGSCICQHVEKVCQRMTLSQRTDIGDGEQTVREGMIQREGKWDLKRIPVILCKFLALFVSEITWDSTFSVFV